MLTLIAQDVTDRDRTALPGLAAFVERLSKSMTLSKPGSPCPHDREAESWLQFGMLWKCFKEIRMSSYIKEDWFEQTTHKLDQCLRRSSHSREPLGESETSGFPTSIDDDLDHEDLWLWDAWHHGARDEIKAVCQHHWQQWTDLKHTMDALHAKIEVHLEGMDS